MFSSPENDRIVRIMNLCLSVVAVICLVVFGFMVMYDRNTQEKTLSESIQYSKEEEDKQRQEIFRERQEKAEWEKRKETDSFYQKLNDGFDVKILVIGDEIGSGDGVEEKSDTWTEQLRQKIKNTYNVEAYIKNISMSGNSSYAGYIRTMVLSDRVQYDLAIICYGQNDENKKFQMYYESIIRALRSKYDKCSIISILESSQRQYTSKMKVIDDLASYYGIQVADTITPFTDGTNGKYSELVNRDGFCPNKNGYAVYADTIFKIIDEQVDLGTAYNDTELEPVNKDVVDFDNLIPINARDFTKEGNTFTYSVNHPITGILGIDYKYITGENTCKILIDGKEYKPPESSVINDTFQLRILVINDKPITIKSKIEVRFSTTEQTSGFRGVCVSAESFKN